MDQYPDVAGVLDRTRAAGVGRVVAVTFTPSHYATLIDDFRAHDGIELAIGLHPMAVAQKIPFLDPIDLDAELELFALHAPSTRFVGEAGMDLSADAGDTRADQERALEGLLAIPGVAGKVLTLHNRSAVSELVALLRACGAQRPILHSYTGTVGQLDDALDAGCHVSINPAMTLTDLGSDVIAALPRERVLAESDGPFMQFEGRSLEPRDVGLVHAHLAQLWDLTPGEVVALVERNFDVLVAGAT
jgi:TatD DNase family protein